MPKVSVILTSFNHEKYLRQTIESAINQTFSDFELIILDDCSSDNSWGIINEYSDPRIRAFRSDKPGQVVFWISDAITNLAIGDYIAIHHSDDVWELDKLEKQVAFLSAHPDYGAVFTNALAINEDSLPLTDEKHFYFNVFNQPNRTRHEWLRHFFLNGNALCHPSLLIRKSCYENCGLFRYGLAQVPDFDMWIRLCMKYEIHVLPERLVKFRVRDNEANSSGNRPETRIRSAYEYYKLLQTYRDIVRIDEVFKIFPDYVSYGRGKNTDAEYVLARVCLESNSFFLKHLLGIEILFDILNDPKRRQAVEKAYGFSQTDFLAITGQYDVFSREDVFLLNEQVADFRQIITEKELQVADFKKEITSLNQAITKRELQIAELDQAITKRELQLAALNQEITKRDERIARLKSSIATIHESTSWRITKPLRYAVLAMRGTRHALFELPNNVQKCGGLLPALRETLDNINKKGAPESKLSQRPSYKIKPPILNAEASKSNLSIVPYYIDSKLDSDPVTFSKEPSLAVHLHLFYTEMLQEFVSYLNNIPVQYDLYVSIPETIDSKAIQLELNKLLTKVKSVIVEAVPNQGGGIAPFIIQFGERLVQYEIIAHIHTKKSTHNNMLAGRCQDVLVKLMGSPGSSGGRIVHIFELLQPTAKIVFPEGHAQLIKDYSGWTNNYDLEKKILNKYTKFSIKDYPVTELPEGSMFWARSECLKDFLKLPLKYHDFSSEPIASDGNLAHTLERLILIFASRYEGQCIRIHTEDSIRDYRFYENQQDNSSSIIHRDIKVLSYYLPQFRPIPENDLWHGEGFTEWTKVKAANPLFEGHYQQHIPHPDIGYYLLDSVETLKQQAELMQKSGVCGQVFYHYWFSGKLILEETAQLLLDTPDIQMPFCFCWANENWTRRWDGNENEILLGQNYSHQDAIDFINYLVPFFKDSRYIKVDDRPVLFVYRPSSIPNSSEYLDSWRSECAKAGVKPPYVVAVLTRGATSPIDFGMDAGVERVLHDWTDGVVPEIKHSLHSYQPINGSALSYEEVANFYMVQTEAKDFTYFRSLIPIWDNTARYGSEAYLLHGSTPQRFQEWMESTIVYTQATLPPDRRFVLVNAWNEWAEGAHLEPDSRFGYSYLNSVGRALSGIPYSGGINANCSLPTGTRIHLSLPDFILDVLRKDSNLKDRFIFCLAKSSVFNICSISMNVPELSKYLPATVQTESDDTDFILEFRRVVLFDSSVIEKMIQTACVSGSVVIANNYDHKLPFIEVTANGSIHSFVGHVAPLLILPKTSVNSGFKNFRMRADARCIEVKPSIQPKMKPVVTTIIRFHKSANINELRNALYCLAAMMDCIVIPSIAAQDLSEQQIEGLKNTLNDIPWTQGYEPQLHLYQSENNEGDLRSKMLNESLRKVKTRYAAFLDFDDLLMPHAYSWLIDRLEKTGKAVSFGRVYATSYDSSTGLLTDRKRDYEYGYSYEEFVQHNHSPIHSFMLDLERLDINHTSYFEDQRYMEDYLLTLQLFTQDNCDWESLRENCYIGDYIHSLGRSHTLAFSNDQDRQAMLTNPEYLLCEQRICNMRESILQEGLISVAVL